MRSDVKNQDNLLDSAAKVFRGRLSSGSRFQALLDGGSQAMPGAGSQSFAAVEGEGISLPYTLRLSRSVESTAAQIGDMPPQPPTLRGRIGAVLVQAVRRGLFWYTNQIRAFQGKVAEAAGEQASAVQELEARQERQQALIGEALNRLSSLEREREENLGQLRALDDRVSALPDRLRAIDELVSALRDGQNTFDNRLHGLSKELASSSGRIAGQEQHLQEVRKAQEEWRDELSRKLIFVGENAEQHQATLGIKLGQIEETLAHVNRSIEAEGREVRRQIHKERTRLVQQEFRLNLLLREVRRDSGGEWVAGAAQTIAADIERANDALFVEHARAFRGDRAEIKSRLLVYTQYAQEAFVAAAGAPALDLGCGRGEWLELLGDMKIPASGIDWNRELVQGCRERGFDARQGDIPRVLTTIPDESLSIVTAFHVLEHIPFSDLLEVIDHAVRILRPGGIAIFETPNPKNSFVSSNNFYLDPTHRHPIPSELLAFVVESRGLCSPKVMPLSPYPEHFQLPASECPAVQFINDHFYGPQDYGIVGFKAN